MKCIKLCLAMIMVVTLVLGNSVFASNIYTVEDKEQYAESVKLLETLGILDSNQRKDVSSTITRSEFAKIIVKLIGYPLGENSMNEGDTRFTDVSDDNEYSSYIYAAAKIGLISAGEVFRPNDELLYEEALKAIVCLLGYQLKAENNGGYPQGYIMTAQTIGLAKSVQGYRGYPITFSGLVKTLVYGLEVDMMLQTGFEANNATYSIVKGKNLLTEYFDCEKVKGVVETTRRTNLNLPVGLNNKYICINGKNYYSENDYSRYLGHMVEFYAKIDSTHSYNDNEIIYLKNPKNLNDILTIKADRISSYTNRVYTYYVDDSKEKEEKETVPFGSYIIYNGRAVSNSLEKFMFPTSGSVTFIDNNKDGKYDVVLIVDYTYFIVNNVDYKNEKIFDKYDSSKVVDLSQQIDYLSMIDTTGSPVKLSAIKEWDVLSVAKSDDNKIISIIVSKKSVHGTATEIFEDAINGDKISVGDEVYDVVAEYASEINIALNDTGIFYLDMDDKIAAFKKGGKSDLKTGFLLKAMKLTKAMDDKLQFKIIDSSGKVVVLTGAEKIVVYNVQKKDSDGVLGILKKKATDGIIRVIPQVIQYRLNIKGELVEMNTPYNHYPKEIYKTATPEKEESEDSLRLLYSSNYEGNGTLLYNSNQMTYSGMINITQATVIFKLPRQNIDALIKDIDSIDDIEYTVRSAGNYANDEWYSVDGYSSGSNNMISDIAVSWGSGIDEDYGVVSKINSVVNDEGSVVTRIIVEIYDRTKEIFTDNDKLISNINVGDFISFDVNVMNMLRKSPEKIFNSLTWEISGVVNNVSVYANDRFMTGYVCERNDNLISLNKTFMNDSNKPQFSRVEKFVPNSNIYSFDRVEKKLKKATINEIYDYKHNGDLQSKLFIWVRFRSPTVTVIYK